MIFDVTDFVTKLFVRFVVLFIGHRVRFYMRSGQVITMRFQEFTLKRDQTGKITGWNGTGSKKHSIMVEEVVAVLMN